MIRSTRDALLVLHRQLALILAPLFVVVLLSAALLAFKPIVEDLRGSVRPVDPRALVALLDRVDPDGTARMVAVAPNRTTVTVRPGPQSEAAGTSYDLATGQLAPPPPFDWFDFAKRLHIGLLIGASIVVVVAALAMTLVVISGPLLALPRLRNTLLGWHTVLGWILLPVAALTPVTGLLVGLGIGGPVVPSLPSAERPVALARAIERATLEGVDLGGLVLARSFAGGNVRLTSADGRGGSIYHLASASMVRPAPGAPGLVRKLHEGTWGGAWSGALNLLSVTALGGLLTTGVIAWARRWRSGRKRTGDAGADILVAYASQTGTAARLAEATAESLRSGGARVATASLRALEPAELVAARHTLLVVSTAGEGDPPDEARPFLKKLTAGALPGATFAMLALGDRRYGDENFCRGGEAVRAALLAAGAREEAPLARADGEPREAWRAWLEQSLARLHLAASTVVAPAADQAVTLALVRREQLNDPDFTETSEVWALTFESAEPLAFRPGDLLLVPPPGGGPERPYSIGSSPAEDPRRILLTVALTHRSDPDGRERLGAASGLLCRGLEVGDELRGALRRHPSFNPPEDFSRPLILVAAGCGIAPFVGFLAEREAAAAAGERVGPIWVVFGNRRAAGDFFHRDRFEQWRASGLLTRLDSAFSRDPGDGAYVQDRLRAAGADVVEWIAERGAVLYVCGRASTLGASVDEALRDIIVEQGLAGERADADRRVAAWEAAGQIRRDLFD